MISELYRGLNFFVFLLLGCLLCAIQSVVLKLSFLAWLEIDLFLLLAVYLSLHRPLLEGTFLVALLARIMEVHSGAPAGILIASYLGVFLAILFTKEMFLVGTSFSSIVLAMAGGVIYKVIFLLLAERFGYLGNIWRASLEYSVPFLLSLGIFSRPCFELFHKIDTLTKYERESEARELTGEDF